MSANNDELNFIRNEMKNNMSIRNTLLTFCFTSVITTIGFGLTNYNTVPFYIYLIPTIITTAFSCRITYYKDKQARMNAYLNVYYKESLKYENVFLDRSIFDFCEKNKFCSFIINNELLILSIVCVLIYYIKFMECMNFEEEKIKCIIFVLIPIIPCGIQFLILHKVPSYTQKTKEYTYILKHASQ